MILGRLWGRLKFALERFILVGPLNRLLLIAVLIGLLAIAGGALVHAFGGARPPERETFGQALWWAFLRLSDPGYLGDDTGNFVRVVSTALTVLGYVVFLGSLVAIMTQWLNGTLARLQGGYTPLTLNNHLLILGWSSATVGIVREILLSEGRVERFLLRRGARRLRVVILAEEVHGEMIQELRERLGDLWDPDDIILRTGSPLRLEHLRRVDFLRAAAIILPSPDSGPEPVEYPDARTVKSILATGKSSRDAGSELVPLMVAELSDARKVDIATRAYGGNIEAIASDLIIGRLLAQMIRHPGIAKVYEEMLRHDVGSEIYLREFPQLAGLSLAQASLRFASAIPIGVVRHRGAEAEVQLNPEADIVIARGDRLVLVAPNYEAAAPGASAARTIPGESGSGVPLPVRAVPKRRVLVLGWNHVLPALIRELDGYSREDFSVDIMSRVPGEERSAELARHEASPKRVRLRLLEGEYTSLADINALSPSEYDNVVILSSDRLESEGDRDARTILGSLVLREALHGAERSPNVLVELLDAENVALVSEFGFETLHSPLVMSHILTQVALNRDLRVIYDELFGPEGAEIFFRQAGDYGICGRPLTFVDVQKAAHEYAEIALGVRVRRGSEHNGYRILLNPDRAEGWELGEDDAVVVLTRGAN